MQDDKPQILKLTWPFVLGVMLAEAAALGVVIGLYWLATRDSAAQSPTRLQDANHAVRASAEPIQAIRKLSDDQAAAWNRGDLEGFMAGYWNDERLTFYSGGDVTTGWQATLDRYRRRYQGQGKAMGKLAFSEIDVVMLNDDCAMASGRWRLDMPDKNVFEGLFTLILRKFGNDWRIVRDHTSLKPPEKP